MELLNLDLDEAHSNIESLPRVDQYKYLGLHAFLGAMLAQNADTYDSFFDNTRLWIKKLSESSDRKGFVSATDLFNISIYRAVLASQFSNYSQSARELVRSYRYYKRMYSSHPAHPASLGAAGLLKVITEQIPDQYLRYTRMLGVDLPEQEGYELLARSYRLTTRQAKGERIVSGLLWTFVLWEFQPDHQACWKAWKNVSKADPELALVRYSGVVCALRSGRNDRALELLQDMTDHQQFSSNPHTYYLRGEARLYTMNQGAPEDFRNFIRETKGDNYIKSAWLRIGWYYTMLENTLDAERSFARVLSDGNNAVWADKQAIREVKKKPLPKKKLLELRLLYDGGYYSRCINACSLLEADLASFSDLESVEVLYRLSSSYHNLGQKEKALEGYNHILSDYRDTQTYQLPKVALLSAQILADHGDNQGALNRLDLCQRLNHYGYRSTFKRQSQALRRKLD
ncbi:MAG: hypothetical protein J7L96_09905 [Bacteroidales bacterium]|nr:hypothetical protein [Bacteroidales bacterium]